MRHILSRSLLTVAAASSILAATGGYASADSDAHGGAGGSAGVLSGNSLELPVDAPVNACGNTANVVGAENPAFGNSCANESHSHHGRHSSYASAEGDNTGSPGVLSGNSVKAPVHAPVNVCGNTVDPVALLNPAMGDSCDSGVQTAEMPPPPKVVQPPSETRGVPPVYDQVAPVHAAPTRLAETGVGGRQLGEAGATSAALLLGGAMLYRRGRRPRPAHAYS
ncbi:MAG TPA: chaplin [Streptomyces sp.]